MKKFPVLLLALAAVCLLAACTSEEEKPSQKTAYDPAADSQVLLEAGIFSETLEAVDTDMLCTLYGLDESTVTDCAAYLSTGATAEELVILVLSDEAAAQTAETACQTRIDYQRTSFESYKPSEVSKLDAAVVKRLGNTVLLAVGDPDTVSQAVEDLDA